VSVTNSVSTASAGSAYADGACIIRVVPLDAEIGDVKDGKRDVGLTA